MKLVVGGNKIAECARDRLRRGGLGCNRHLYRVGRDGQCGQVNTDDDVFEPVARSVRHRHTIDNDLGVDGCPGLGHVLPTPHRCAGIKGEARQP